MHKLLEIKFVIHGAQAVLIDFNGNCGLQNATSQTWFMRKLFGSAEVRILEPIMSIKSNYAIKAQLLRKCLGKIPKCY